MVWPACKFFFFIIIIFLLRTSIVLANTGEDSLSLVERELLRSLGETSRICSWSFLGPLDAKNTLIQDREFSDTKVSEIFKTILSKTGKNSASEILEAKHLNSMKDILEKILNENARENLASYIKILSRISQLTDKNLIKYIVLLRSCYVMGLLSSTVYTTSTVDLEKTNVVKKMSDELASFLGLEEVILEDGLFLAPKLHWQIDKVYSTHPREEALVLHYLLRDYLEEYNDPHADFLPIMLAAEEMRVKFSSFSHIINDDDFFKITDFHKARNTMFCRLSVCTSMLIGLGLNLDLEKYKERVDSKLLTVLNKMRQNPSLYSEESDKLYAILVEEGDFDLMYTKALENIFRGIDIVHLRWASDSSIASKESKSSREEFLDFSGKEVERLKEQQEKLINTQDQFLALDYQDDIERLESKRNLYKNLKTYLIYRYYPTKERAEKELANFKFFYKSFSEKAQLIELSTGL